MGSKARWALGVGCMGAGSGAHGCRERGAPKGVGRGGGYSYSSSD